TAIATTMFSFRGRAYAITAAAPEITAARMRSRVLASEHSTPTRHSTPAKPRPQALGIRLASAMPSRLAAFHDIHVRTQFPARYDAGASRPSASVAGSGKRVVKSA